MRAAVILALLSLLCRPGAYAQTAPISREELRQKLAESDGQSDILVMEECARIGDPTVPLLIGLLDDPATGVRRAACHCLGEVASRKATKALVGKLNDQEYEVRAAAAWSLGAIRDRAAVPALIAALDDPVAYVGLRVCGALGWIGDHRATDALMGLIVNRERGLEIEAIRALGALRETRAIPLLISVLGEDRMHCWASEGIGALAVGDNASDALAAIGKPAADALISALDDEDPWVRERAATALARVRDWRAADRLVEMVRGDERGPRYAAAGALAALHDRRAAPDVIRWLPTPAEFDNLDSLASGGNDASGPREEKTLDLCWRIEMVGGYLRGMGDARAIKPLIALAGVKVERAQVAAIDGLAGTRNPMAFDYLANLASGSAGEVRCAALRAIGSQRGSRAFPILARTLKSADKDTLRSITQGLTTLGDRRAIPLLIEKARSAPPDGSIILFDLAGMGRAGRAAVVGLLRSDDARLVEQAIDALEMRGSYQSLPEIRRLTKHADIMVAHAAEEAVYSLERDAKRARR